MANVDGLSVFADKVSITPDGRYVVFVSDNPDLAPGFRPAGVPPYTGNLGQVYRLDRNTGTTLPISYRADGTPLAPALSWPDSIGISDDGNLVLFTTPSPGVTVDDGDAKTDVFLRDVSAGTTTRISKPGGGAYARISHNGRYVSFRSAASTYGPTDTDTESDVYRWDRTDGSYLKASTGAGGVESNKSAGKSVPLDDGTVLFGSLGDNLVPGFPYVGSNANVIYRHDAASGNNQVAVLNDGGAIPSSADLLDATPDGISILFGSPSRILASDTGPTNPEVYVQDSPVGGSRTVTPAFRTASGDLVPGSTGTISPDGRFVAGMVRSALIVEDDDNGADDIYMRDRSTNKTYVIDRLPSGAPGNGATSSFTLSGDGTVAVFVATGRSYGPPNDATLITRAYITRTPKP